MTKTLKNYFENLNLNSTVEFKIVEDGTMRPLKKYAQVDIAGAEGLYETNIDRWSRNAKHHLAKAEIANAADQPQYEIGDPVIYNGQEVSVKIPQGPKNTVGIMFEGHLKMVHQSKLTKLEENVVGGLQSLNPLNRIMQLAGLEHSGAVSSELVEEEILNEADAASLISQFLVAVQNMPQYKSNQEAARLFVYGSILSEIYTELQATKLQTVQGQNAMTELSKLGDIGAQLIKTAQALGQGQATTSTAATTSQPAQPATSQGTT